MGSEVNAVSVEHVLRTHADAGRWHEVAEVLGLSVQGKPSEYFVYAPGLMEAGCVFVLHFDEGVRIGGRLGDGSVQDCSAVKAVDILIQLHKLSRGRGSGES